MFFFFLLFFFFARPKNFCVVWFQHDNFFVGKLIAFIIDFCVLV